MTIEKQKCLIVGAGYVGAELARVLLAKGWSVSALRRSKPELEQAKEQGATGSSSVQWITACATSWKPTESYDLVAFCISADNYCEQSYKTAYFDTLKTVASWQPQHGHLIVLSSTSVYPHKEGETVGEACTELADAGPSKWIVQGENAALAIHKKAAVLRLGGIYGPGRDRLIRRVRAGDPIPKSKAFSNRSHRDDIANAMFHVFENSLTGVFNCTDMFPTPISEIYTWLAEKTGTSVQWSNDSSSSRMRGNKKVSSKKLAATGFQWKFADYKSGMQALLDQEASGNAS